mgnify:CR=1 FL=1
MFHDTYLIILNVKINDFNEITVEIVYDMDTNYVSFSNIYDMGKNKEKTR